MQNSLRSKCFPGAKSEETGFSVFCPREKWGESKNKKGGWGRERKETLAAAKHCDFQNRPLGLLCLTDFTLSSSSIQVAFVILEFASFKILDHLIFLSNKNHTRLPAENLNRRITKIAYVKILLEQC